MSELRLDAGDFARIRADVSNLANILESEIYRIRASTADRLPREVDSQIEEVMLQARQVQDRLVGLVRLLDSYEAQLKNIDFVVSDAFSERLKSGAGESAASRSIPQGDQSFGSGSRSLNVTIYLSSSDEENAREIMGALLDLFRLEGLTLSPVGAPEISSWFARFKIKAGRALSDDEVADKLKKIQHAIEIRALDEPMSVVNVNQAEAISKLIQAVDKQDSAILMVGSTIVIKVTDGGKGRVVAKTLTPAEVRTVERNQHLLKDPRLALEQLHLLAGSHKEIEAPFE